MTLLQVKIVIAQIFIPIRAVLLLCYPAFRLYVASSREKAFLMEQSFLQPCCLLLNYVRAINWSTITEEIVISPFSVRLL
jgi:hypothetical protein